MDEAFDKLEALSLPDTTRQALNKVFGTIKENVHIEALDKVVNTFTEFANVSNAIGCEKESAVDVLVSKVHPIFGIVAKALLIPYKVNFLIFAVVDVRAPNASFFQMWREEQKFMGDLKIFASDMCTSLKILASAFPVMESGLTKESALRVLKIVVEAAKYVDGFVIVNKEDHPASHRIKRYAQNIVERMKRILATQFPKKLEGYRTDLRDRRLDLREAILVNVLVNNGAMST